MNCFLIKRQYSGVLPLASLLVAILSIVSCSSTEILDEPIALQTANPLVENANTDLEATLNWVIVRNGPGTWASDADWDEYLMRIVNRSSVTVEVTSVAVVDSLGYTLANSDDLDGLINSSRDTARRYDSLDIDVSAGMGADNMMAAGSVVTLTGTAAVAATTTVVYTGYFGGWAIVGPSAAAVGVLVAGPVIIATSLSESRKYQAVRNEMRSRNSRLPVLIEPGGDRQLNLFFPITPSPQSVEINYLNSSGQHTLILDTQSALDGLHINRVP